MKFKQLIFLCLLGFSGSTFPVPIKHKKTLKPEQQTKQSWWQRRSPEFRAFVVSLSTIIGAVVLRYAWLESLYRSREYELRSRNREQRNRNEEQRSRQVSEMQRDYFQHFSNNMQPPVNMPSTETKVPSTLTQSEKAKLRANNTEIECVICTDLDSLPDEILDGCKKGCNVILCSSCKAREKSIGKGCPFCCCSYYEF